MPPSHDTLMSASSKVLCHNAAIPAWAEPDAPFCFLGWGDGKPSNGGQCTLLEYHTAKIRCGDWKRVPDWYRPRARKSGSSCVPSFTHPLM